MKLLLVILVTLCIPQIAPCFQNCIADLVKKLLTPKKPSEKGGEYRPLANLIRNAHKVPFNEEGKLNDFPIIKKGVDVIMEGTSKPETPTTIIPENKRRNNITIISRSEVDVFTEGDGIDSRLKEDLLDSFGGGTEEKSSFEEGGSTKNGMYFLFDWNTFLEVDDQNGKRVNLRVQPKAGDPKQFIDVTVP